MNVEAGTGQDSTAADSQQTAATSQAADAQTSATTDQAGDQAQQQNAAEVNYEFKMPEGIELDQDAAQEFTAWAKEQGLKPEQAQKVADIGAKMMQKQAEMHAQTVSAWVEQVRADKEIGGDKLEENLAYARAAIDAFGSPELKEILNASGLGNHPAVVKAFIQAGKRIAPDTFVAGNRSPSGDRDPAKTLFPSMN